MSITPEDITNIIGSPIANARKYWPMIIEEMKRTNTNKTSFQVALLATIGVECGRFIPVREYGPKNNPEQYFKDMYDITSSRPNRRRKALELGNVNPGDGILFRGRGFIQLTGRGNYIHAGKDLGIDLVNHPDRALEDDIAVRVLVWFAREHGLPVWADRAYNTADEWPEEFCWRKIRKLVNGGYNHYDKYRRFVDKFKAAA